MDAENLIQLTAQIVVAHLENNAVSTGDLSLLIANVHSALAGLGSPIPSALAPSPAVSVRSSVKSDHIVCLEDGKKVKMLKRHLRAEHGLTPDEYRSKWNLPASYPMVAPNYAEQRKQLALKIGLGKKGAKTTTRSPRGKAKSTPLQK
jgi:predicted transcriptional regulator